MKRHRTDVLSLLFGLLFISLSAWWAVAYYLDWTLNWNVPNFGWFAAGVLIVVGLLGVAASLRRDRPEPALADGPGTREEFSVPQPAPTYMSSVSDTGTNTVDLEPPDAPATGWSDSPATGSSDAPATGWSDAPASGWSDSAATDVPKDQRERDGRE